MAKDIVNGVLITSLIFLVSVFIPIVGFVGALFIPLPVLFYRLKLGRKIGGLIPIIAGLILAIAIGNIATDIIFFGGLLLLGFMLGELFEFNLSIEKTLLYACGGVLLSGLIGLIIFSLISGAGIYTVVSEYVAKNLELTLVLYRGMGMSQENIQLISNSLNQIAHVLVTILPALVTMSTFFVPGPIYY